MLARDARRGEGVGALGGCVDAVDRVVGVAAVEVRDDLAVGVAAHPAHGQLERAEPVEDLGRQRARGDVAADHHRVGASEGVVGEDRVERRQVAVDVVERGDDAHTEGPDGARGARCWPPGSSGSRYHSLILRRSTRMAPRALPPTPVPQLPPGRLVSLKVTIV